MRAALAQAGIDFDEGAARYGPIDLRAAAGMMPVPARARLSTRQTPLSRVLADAQSSMPKHRLALRTERLVASMEAIGCPAFLVSKTSLAFLTMAA